MLFPGKSRLPVLGVGLSFRPEIANAIYGHLDELDFIEVIIDNAFAGAVDEEFTRRVAERMPVVGHGVSCSIGSLEPLDREYIARTKKFARKMKCQWFSDHLAFTQSAETEIGQLMPLLFDDENVAWVAGKIRAASDLLGMPFLIENIAYYFEIPGGTMTEIDFVLRILQAARCGLLLDVNNLYANALNHGFDPYEFLDRVPAEAVVEIHVAGGEQRGGVYVDTHGHAVNEDVWALLDYAVATKRPNAILLEREKGFPPMEELMNEIRCMHRIWQRYGEKTDSSRRTTAEGCIDTISSR